MAAVDQACQLMEQALEILDANGVHHSAALLDSAIHALPSGGSALGGELSEDGTGDGVSQS